MTTNDAVHDDPTPTDRPVDPSIEDPSSTPPLEVLFPPGCAVVGGVPGSGKTAPLGQLIAAAALDPTAELHVFDFKGGGDWYALGSAATGRAAEGREWPAHATSDGSPAEGGVDGEGVGR